MQEISETKPQETILDVKDLRVHYQTDEGDVIAVNGISFQVYRGELVGPGWRIWLWQDNHSDGYLAPGAAARAHRRWRGDHQRPNRSRQPRAKKNCARYVGRRSPWSRKGP